MRIDGTFYIDLNSPDGNAFAIAGLAYTWAKQLGWDEPDLLKDSQSYEQVLNKFDSLFKGKIEYRFINDPRDGEEEEEYA